MKYIINHSNDTAFNIALEEYAFKHLLDEDQIFLLWINKPSIIVGRHQNTIEEINRDYVRENGIEVVRRISGGGAVYHDLNNLNYTIISKEDENKAFDFKSFSTPVINTLAQLGVKAEFTGRNDLEIDGKKFCGNAQAYINGRIMHHGCLLFDVDLSVLANALKGNHAVAKLNLTPAAIYTLPEVAAVGLTEEQAREKYDVAIGKFNFAANGRAIASDAAQGFVKVIADKKYGEILGVHIIGPAAAELINEASSIIEMEITVEEMLKTIHGHPTYSEVMYEAFADVLGMAIHSPKKK